MRTVVISADKFSSRVCRQSWCEHLAGLKKTAFSMDFLDHAVDKVAIGGATRLLPYFFDTN